MSCPRSSQLLLCPPERVALPVSLEAVPLQDGSHEGSLSEGIHRQIRSDDGENTLVIACRNRASNHPALTATRIKVGGVQMPVFAAKGMVNQSCASML